jgi:hypothetical protein
MMRSPFSPGDFERALDLFHPLDQAGDAVLLCDGFENPRLAPDRLTTNRAHRSKIQLPNPSHNTES